MSNIENVLEYKKQRGRPKKIKTEEEINQEKEKKREYHRNYYKERSLIDPEYAERYKKQVNIRTKRFYHNNKERLFNEKEELLRKSKLYDELVANLKSN